MQNAGPCKNSSAAKGCHHTFQLSIPGPCALTIRSMFRLPAAAITPITDNANGISYLMNCAHERIAPYRLYLLFDAHPPRMIPYAERPEIASKNSSPMSTPGAMIARNPGDGSDVDGPNGTTAIDNIAQINPIVGAMM